MTIYSRDGADPAPLPFRIRLPDGRTRTSPETFTADEIAAAGYVAAPDRPRHDPATERVVWRDGGWVVEALPEVARQPVVLSKIALVRLGQQAGGMTDELLVASTKDAALDAFWLKIDMVDGVNKDAEETVQGLAALEATGYLPGGAQAVLDAWPTEPAA